MKSWCVLSVYELVKYDMDIDVEDSIHNIYTNFSLVSFSQFFDSNKYFLNQKL